MLPLHVGTPIGKRHAGTTYYMVENHYDNPDLRSGKSLKIFFWYLRY